MPKCPESWSVASVYAMLERVFNLDEVPLQDSSHTATASSHAGCAAETEAEWGTIQCLGRKKQCITVNTVTVCPEYSAYVEWCSRGNLTVSSSGGSYTIPRFWYRYLKHSES